jgi:hypothetical protein
LEQNVNHQPVWEIPKLRRVIEITYFDSCEPIVHKLELYKTSRIDCYDVYVDGAIWKKRIGWSQILAGIRKAMPRRINVYCFRWLKIWVPDERLLSAKSASSGRQCPTAGNGT